MQWSIIIIFIYFTYMEHEKMIPGEEESGEENEDLGLKVEDNLEVTTEHMREEERKLDDKKGPDAWREQK